MDEKKISKMRINACKDKPEKIIEDFLAASFYHDKDDDKRSRYLESISTESYAKNPQDLFLAEITSNACFDRTQDWEGGCGAYGCGMCPEYKKEIQVFVALERGCFAVISNDEYEVQRVKEIMKNDFKYIEDSSLLKPKEVLHAGMKKSHRIKEFVSTCKDDREAGL